MTKEEYYKHILKSDMQEQTGITIHKDSFIFCDFIESFPIKKEDVEYIVLNDNGLHFYGEFNPSYGRFDPIHTFTMDKRFHARVDSVGKEIYIHIRVLSDDPNRFIFNIVAHVPNYVLKNYPLLTMTCTEYHDIQIDMFNKLVLLFANSEKPHLRY